MEDASPVIDIHPKVDILSTHQYEKLYMMEDASPVFDIHPNVDILSTHQYEKLYDGRCKIGRAHVWTPVTCQNLVCRLLLEKKKKNKITSIIASVALIHLHETVRNITST